LKTKKKKKKKKKEEEEEEELGDEGRGLPSLAEETAEMGGHPPPRQWSRWWK